MNSYFEGEPVVHLTKDCSDDWFPCCTKMEFLADFAFIDSTGYKWEAKRGDVIESEAILDVVWSKIAGESSCKKDFHRACIIYDVACEKSIKTSKDASRMLYEALLIDGASQPLALLLYTAIRLYGPKWDDTTEFSSSVIFCCSLRDYPLLDHPRYANPLKKLMDFDTLEVALDSAILMD